MGGGRWGLGVLQSTSEQLCLKLPQRAGTRAGRMRDVKEKLLSSICVYRRYEYVMFSLFTKFCIYQFALFFLGGVAGDICNCDIWKLHQE